jgi:chromosome partitioning protein
VSAPVTIALLKRKGGSGATIAAGSLAVALAELGHRVAAIDLDPQGSLALWARSGQGKLAGIVTSIEVQEVADLRAAVAATDADRVILDAPPGFDRPSLVAALVADVAIVPVAPASFDVAAAREVVELIGEARERRAGAGPVVLMLPSRVTRTAEGTELAAVLERLGEVLPPIALRNTFVRAASVGQTVIEYDKRSPATAEVWAVAAAVEKRIAQMTKGRAAHA